MSSLPTLTSKFLHNLILNKQLSLPPMLQEVQELKVYQIDHYSQIIICSYIKQPGFSLGSAAKSQVATFASHRGWVWKGNVSPPAEGDSFWIYHVL